MKKKFIRIFIPFFILLGTSIINSLFSQGSSWEKAKNCGCYFQTSPGSIFTWSGSISNSYCNGYGTIQWYNTSGTEEGKFVGTLKNGKAEGYATQYYPNGKKYYDGYWKNDMRHGYGTSYNQDGTILYQGYFENDYLKNITLFKKEARAFVDTLVKKIFLGGKNTRCSVTKAVFNTDQSLHEVWIDVSFNGNIDESNLYYFTFKYNEKWDIPADFFDYSKNCEPYLYLLLASNLIKFFEDISQ